MRTILCCLALMLFAGTGFGAQRWDRSEYQRERNEHRRLMREHARERQALKRETRREHQRLRKEFRERHRMLHGYRRGRVV